MGDTYLAYDRLKKPSSYRKTSSVERLNDKYIERMDNFEKVINDRCKKTEGKGYLCPRDRHVLSTRMSGLSTFEFETPSGYYNAQKIKESKLYGTSSLKKHDLWGQCPPTKDSSLQLRGCVKGDANRLLVQSLGNSCQKTSSAYTDSRGSDPIGCAGSVGHAMNYKRLENPKLYSKFLDDTIRELEAEEEDVLNDA